MTYGVFECIVEGCSETERLKRGLCRIHYERWRNHKGIEALEVDLHIPPSEGLRWCNGCKQFISFEDYGKATAKKHGFASYCKKCLREKRAVVYASGYQLKRNYNLTLEDIQQKLQDQDNKCTICGHSLLIRKGKQALYHVDHNHNTNTVRDLLCPTCNHLIGFSQENPKILLRAARYLQDHEVKEKNYDIIKFTEHGSGY